MASGAGVVSSLRLEAVDFWMERKPGPLGPRIRAALAERGEPLRWAITAVEPGPGGSGGRRLRLEAVVIHRHG